MADLQATGTDPGVQWLPTEAPLHYFEDREISGHLWRTQNALYTSGTPGTWKQQDTTQASFAIVQNPDGSISHYSAPVGTTTPWSTWPTTIGEYGVFNVLSFGAVPDGSTLCDTAFQAARNVSTVLRPRDLDNLRGDLGSIDIGDGV